MAMKKQTRERLEEAYRQGYRDGFADGQGAAENQRRQMTTALDTFRKTLGEDVEDAEG